MLPNPVATATYVATASRLTSPSAPGLFPLGPQNIAGDENRKLGRRRIRLGGAVIMGGTLGILVTVTVH